MNILNDDAHIKLSKSINHKYVFMKHSYHLANAVFTKNNCLNRAKQFRNILNDDAHIKFSKSINHKYVFMKHSYHLTNAVFT